MLVVSGIILTCLSGLLLTGIIGTRFSWTERIGLSFTLGMTLQTVVMALLDLMHIPLTSFSVLSAVAVTFALLMFFVVLIQNSKGGGLASSFRSEEHTSELQSRE